LCTSSYFRRFYVSHVSPLLSFFFFFNDPATTEIYTLSLHGRSSDLAPKSVEHKQWVSLLPQINNNHGVSAQPACLPPHQTHAFQDRKSTRLNSSHVKISYAVFCLKKKKKKIRKNNTYTQHNLTCKIV